MEHDLKAMEQRIARLEANLMELVDLHTRQSHWMTLMARQVREMAHQIDVNIEPPRMN